MRQAAKLFIIIFALVNFIGCKDKLIDVASSNSYNWARNNQTYFSQKDTLTFIYFNDDSLSGEYNFIILPGYEGRALNLKIDSSFTEEHWTDYHQRPKRNNGKWYFKNGKLTLKLFKDKLTLNVHQYSWATFLVPETKTEIFAYEFNRNKRIIDSLATHLYDTKGIAIDKCLSDLSTLCYIKRVKNRYSQQ